MKVAPTGATGYIGSHALTGRRGHWYELTAIGLAASLRADPLFSSSAEEQVP
jgi:hypothetical protein